MKVRVLKRFGQWHWWCPCCMGGDWHDTIRAAWAEAAFHAATFDHEQETC